ncbi:WxL domain-containing protein [Paenibacillus montanisoli]|uniref:WxL domain-containing protein n=1 Tax=Paenibacillus montanisoli TaxID=2081970 RepID=A0A328TT11_9BACL|nr:WxL domain-containing protein [Paenibacillus montanisoli]RAP73687.1 WxL domain-containing protein [Paenibacillus montanisoli]
MNIKKSLISGVLGLLIVLTLVSPAAIAATANTGTSTGHVSLTTGAPTTPVDPIYPNVPDGSTGNIGALTIDNITSLEFGSWQVSNTTLTVASTISNPNTQVTDVRGTGAGWKLQVASSTFASGGNTLKGASIYLPAGTAQTISGNTSTAPVLNAVTLDTTAGTAVDLMSAEAGSGMGTWADLMDPTQIKLTIPAGNLAGNYTATLTWTLVDAP